jgi:hypothetical protein
MVINVILTTIYIYIYIYTVVLHEVDVIIKLINNQYPSLFFIIDQYC